MGLFDSFNPSRMMAKKMFKTILGKVQKNAPRYVIQTKAHILERLNANKADPTIHDGSKFIKRYEVEDIALVLYINDKGELELQINALVIEFTNKISVEDNSSTEKTTGQFTLPILQKLKLSELATGKLKLSDNEDNSIFVELTKKFNLPDEEVLFDFLHEFQDGAE